MPRIIFIAVMLLPLLGPGAAQAQIPGLPSGTPKLPGGLSSMAGIPDLSSMSAGNAAGAISYCMKNKLLGGADASSVLSGLTSKPGVASSADYKAGAAGKVATSGGSGLSIGSLEGEMKTKACDLVLKNAKHLL